MKKITSIILASLLALSATASAFATEVPGSDSKEITATYVQPDPDSVYEVDIIWGSMEFDYNSGLKRVWNPDTLQYSDEVETEPSWTPSDENGDIVTVKNHSNETVEIKVTYTKDADNGVDGTLTNDGFLLTTAEDTTVEDAPNNSAQLALSTENMPESFKEGSTGVTVGTLTVTIHNDGYAYDESTDTYIVYNSDGLYAWNEAVQEYISTNVTDNDRDGMIDNIGNMPNLTLVDDITLTGENNWTPVGCYSSKSYSYILYTGNIDGGGHTISGLHINSNEESQAFVGALNEGNFVKNLTFTNANVTGGRNSGIVVGFNCGTIENCHVTSGKVIGTEGYVGGIAGYSCGYITGCTNAATVEEPSESTNGYVGGIVGENVLGTVTACINTGDISSDRVVGGVAGDNERGTVVACGNMGTVSYSYYLAGGIVGRAVGSSLNYSNNISSWTIDTAENDSYAEVTTNKDGVGYEYFCDINNCYSGDATTINDNVINMNNAIGSTYGYIWQAGTDGYPTLIKVAE